MFVPNHWHKVRKHAENATRVKLRSCGKRSHEMTRCSNWLHIPLGGGGVQNTNKSGNGALEITLSISEI